MEIIAVTIKDVARVSGLSIATISKYLNGGNVLEQNRVRIEQAIRSLNFKVNEIARGLKTNKTMTIGVLIPNLENIFCMSIISNIENVLIQQGYSTIICDARDDERLEKEKMEFLLSKMVDGVITMPLPGSGEHITEAVRQNIPVVLIDRAFKGVDCDAVLVDNLNASYQAVEHLIVKGHKRIGIICGPENIFTTQERLKGYLRVHEDYSMETGRDLIQFGDYRLESGYELLLRLMELNPRPTAVFVTNYEMTLGAIIAINEKNLKIPEDLSIIGFDNLQMAKIVKPSLSIVVQPMQQIGETAAHILLRRLRGDMGSFPSMCRLKAEVLLKDSVRALNT